MRACPREGCGNQLHRDDMILCTGDFHALAGMCRGKKRLGEPEASFIEGRGRGRAYRCPICKQWHNGNQINGRADFLSQMRDAARALRDDPRVGWRGMIALADAWAPGMSERRSWSEGLDQQVAVAAA